MLKTIKRTTLACLSILGISLLVWTILLLNPSLSYANKTQFEFVTVYHNNPLEENTENIIKNAVAIIQGSEIFEKEISIDLCLNDDPIYPHLHPLIGEPFAFALLDKTIIKNCTTSFDKNVLQIQWAVNNNEIRLFDMTWMLAHEFMHNLQYEADWKYYITSTLGKINWKLEGHAEYISREFKADNLLKEKIKTYLEQAQEPHIGIPVFELKNGTQQTLSYYKYALVIQYLIEEKALDYKEICAIETSLEDLYNEMLEWSETR